MLMASATVRDTRQSGLINAPQLLAHAKSETESGLPLSPHSPVSRTRVKNAYRIYEANFREEEENSQSIVSFDCPLVVLLTVLMFHRTTSRANDKLNDS